MLRVDPRGTIASVAAATGCSAPSTINIPDPASTTSATSRLSLTCRG